MTHETDMYVTVSPLLAEQFRIRSIPISLGLYNKILDLTRPLFLFLLSIRMGNLLKPLQLANHVGHPLSLRYTYEPPLLLKLSTYTPFTCEKKRRLTTNILLYTLKENRYNNSPFLATFPFSLLFSITHFLKTEIDSKIDFD